MVRQMIYRDMLENATSLRFILSLLLAILLFTVAGFVFAAKYRHESQDYWKDTNKNLSDLSEKTKRLCDVALYEQKIYRKPIALALLAEGFEKYFPNRFRFNIFSMDIPEVRSRADSNVGRFREIDLVFIISVILSFVALVFTYNTICGERENGTLRLILAASIPRYKILLGKYIGMMLTLGIPLLLGLLLSLLIITSSGEIMISTGDWFKVIAFVILSFLYLSFFVLLGMFVSSRTAHSANSMVILLLAWVGLVILIPSSGRIVSDAICENPSQAELQRKLAEVYQQIMDDAASGKFGKNPSYFGSSELENPRGTAMLDNAITEGQNRAREDHLNRMIVPYLVGRYLTRLSPTVSYQCASEVIVGTGINRFKSQYQQIKRYQQELKAYVRGKDAEDPESLHLLCSKGQAINKWGVISKKPVDFDTVPKFQERKFALGQSMKPALWDLSLLVLFNLTFFAASYISFLHYDVR